jgi:hypothetical protein
MDAAGPLRLKACLLWRARPISVPWSRVGSVDDAGPPCRCEDLALHELSEFWTLVLEVPDTNCVRDHRAAARPRRLADVLRP